MNKVQARRILKLADFLQDVPRKKFDYTTWFAPKKEYDTTKRSLEECGTAACAAGWACTMPTFKRLGLKLELSVKKEQVHDTVKGTNVLREYIDPTLVFGGVLKDSDAVAAVFGDDSLCLFYPLGYLHSQYGVSPPAKATPKQVAKAMRKHVKAQYLELVAQ